MATLRFSLRQLELFSTVARMGSTSAAGDEAALSQSAVSSAVNELEQTLGVTLFDRVSKRLVLNDAGRALQERATRLIWDARKIEREFSGGHPPCHLKIAASTTIGNYLGPLIPQTVLGSSEAIKYAVELGLGISCLSRILVQCMLDNGAVIELRTDFPRLTRPLSIVSQPARPPSVAMSEFLNPYRTG
ncbi:LysR family transcriptional regulator [Cupriavidus sp. TMH.W2]|uniref:LysR family transcriptional regulator n=1 Tax=Cupriavidus sp. TMH.W2 TaxID=3434465 RepID=UPI003D7840E4